MASDSSSGISPSSLAPSQDPTSCYFLHPNENPSLILVSPSLVGSNYHHWARAMLIALMSKNKHQFVDGSLAIPVATDPLFPAWQRCNTMVLTWLFRSISPSISQSVMWLNRAVDVWNDLKERFSQSDAFRVAELQDELFQIRQGDLSVSDYFTKIKIIWDELLNFRPIADCSCSSKEYFRQDYVIRFLKGLNDRFANVRSQILLMDPLPSINKAFSLIVQQERDLIGITEPNICFTRTDSSSKPAYQPKSNTSNKMCTFCGKPRHTVETCYKKHGFPPGYKFRNKASVNNVVTSHPSSSPGILSSTPTAANSSSISQDQYNHLLALLQSHSVTLPAATHASNASVPTTTPAVPSCVNQLSALTLIPNADAQRSEDMENDWYC
ncbi:hypothetical protein QN277_016124 [Acacia crassicarpa]|uniref:Retrotransposon Copia-like N-terminal domain-containing protein n=1 Tax=Acacia crassicarpa TaxID=499986 RepID=A0AAE1MW01_9FABA|nr:hypothetical protein QN277_016124 [Acacia crassicarpa]